MFANLPPQSEDKIMALMQAFAADARADKLDLGIGVYRDAMGHTPVLRAVKEAERRNIAAETTKTYNRFIGDAGYIAAVRDLVLGDCVPADQVTGSQTPGGTSALRCLFELTRMANPGVTIWVPEPSWPNHAAMLTQMGLRWRSYRYFDPVSGSADVEGILTALRPVAAGDVVLLHGCCHNPTGADLDPEGWQTLAAHALARGWVPLIDLAYLGFGAGPEADVAPLRAMIAQLPEAMVAVSFSKTMGLYRDRAGATLVTGASAAHIGAVSAGLTAINRLTYSFAPHPAAAIVTTVLTSPDLDALWRAELAQMRQRITDLRAGLAHALQRETNAPRFNALLDQRGMFSRLPLAPEQVEQLRMEQGIYMMMDGRMNIAGLTPERIDRFAAAVAGVLRP